ncbi:MAG: hypothetical protein AB1810_12590 [Pseudomonadota bacterium]
MKRYLLVLTAVASSIFCDATECIHVEPAHRESHHYHRRQHAEGRGGDVVITAGGLHIVASTLTSEPGGCILRVKVSFSSRRRREQHSRYGELIEAVAARYVLISSGYRNRFRHPKPEIVNDYRETGAEILETAREGAVEFVIQAKHGILPPRKYRQDHPRFWHRGHERAAAAPE